MPDRDPAADLGLAEAMRARGTGLASTSLLIRIAVATTVSFLVGVHLSQSSFPIFAPITTLLVVQASPFTTIGVAAQRILGTGLGVLAASLYVNFLPITWWSVLLALLAALFTARALPVGIAGQLQIPIAVVFVLALGAGSFGRDAWRLIDVLIGGVIGLIAVFIAPPRPKIKPARIMLDAYLAGVTGLLRSMAAEAGSHSIPLPSTVRHAFVGDSRALRPQATAMRDAYATAVESTRFNPRARKTTAELTQLQQRTSWAHRLTLQARALAGSIDRLYDREGIAPALPPALIAPLLKQVSDLISATRDGEGERADAINLSLAQDLHDAVSVCVEGRRDVADVLDSIGVLGRLEQLREVALVGPLREDDLEQVAGEIVIEAADGTRRGEALGHA